MIERRRIGAWASAALLACMAVPAGAQFFRALAPARDSEPPARPFSAALAPPAPDYGRRTSWAALPGIRDGADVTPPGVAAINQMRAPADVFFLYPTVFTSGSAWNADTRDAALNARIDSTRLRNQASVFNGCCAIYAPRYRQVTIGGFVHWSDDSQKALNLAYSDVARAFRYYLAHLNRGRPFILAGHSQGSRLARLLIAREIDGKPAARRMIAAYIPGNWIDMEWFAGLRSVKPCQRGDDLGCVIGWSTFSEGHDAAAQRRWKGEHGGPPADALPGPHFCMNPLDWSTGGETVPKARNLGAWLWGEGDRPRAPDVGLVSARCDDGALYVSPPGERVYADLVIPFGNYHNADYQLAYMNVRENASVRVAAFLRRGRGAIGEP